MGFHVGIMSLAQAGQGQGPVSVPTDPKALLCLLISLCFQLGNTQTGAVATEAKSQSLVMDST